MAEGRSETRGSRARAQASRPQGKPEEAREQFKKIEARLKRNVARAQESADADLQRHRDKQPVTVLTRNYRALRKLSR